MTEVEATTRSPKPFGCIVSSALLAGGPGCLLAGLTMLVAAPFVGQWLLVASGAVLVAVGSFGTGALVLVGLLRSFRAQNRGLDTLFRAAAAARGGREAN